MDKSGAPPLVENFLNYIQDGKGLSPKTADQYFMDLRLFIRFMKQRRGLSSLPLREIPVADADAEFFRSVTITDVNNFLRYLRESEPQHPQSAYTEYGIDKPARARKISALRAFYKYLTVRLQLFDENPVKDFDSIKIDKTLPRFLGLEECTRLLSNVRGKHSARDYCILTLFLNCGLRISELQGLDLADLRREPETQAWDALIVKGKGGKERTVFLNGACAAALDAWLAERETMSAEPKHKDALFLSQKNMRIHVQRIHQLVKKHLAAGGLDRTRYSAHKLRHTAATLMLYNGVDVKVLQEILGHEHLNTTQIYTHVENAQLREAARLNPLGGVRKEP